MSTAIMHQSAQYEFGDLFLKVCILCILHFMYVSYCTENLSGAIAEPVPLRTPSICISNTYTFPREICGIFL